MTTEEEHPPEVVLAGVMANRVYEIVCRTSAVAAKEAEEEGVTQHMLLFSLWCFLSNRFLFDGLDSQTLVDCVLHTERLIHGQDMPS